jgi:methyl-accepting chemotaxis protein
MSDTSQYRDHAAAYNLDAAAIADLREAWNEIEPALPSILDVFYAKWRKEPKLAAMIGARGGHLKEAQARHWKRLFSGAFDADYFDSVRRVGLAHVKIGLEPHWYIAGYNEVLDHILAHIGDNHRLSGRTTARRIKAVTRAILLDMDVAVSVYSDTLMTQALDRNERTEAAIRCFDAKVEGLLANLASTSSSLGGLANGLSGQSQAVTHQADDIMKAQDKTVDGITTTAGATEELHASIGEIGQQAEASLAVSTRAVEIARRTATSVADLAGAVERIGSVAKLISDIAAQTNLLALNATIEAARAGEAGKGFAVVASEVKSLASQTAKATEEITAQIEAIQQATHLAVADISAIGGTIDEVARIGTAIAAAVEEQSAATQDIASSAANVSRSAEETSSAIMEVRRMSEETSRSSGDVTGLSADLGRQAAHLRESVDEFVAKVASR